MAPVSRDEQRYRAAKRLMANGTRTFEELPPQLQRGYINVTRERLGDQRAAQNRRNELAARQSIADGQSRANTLTQVDESSMQVAGAVNRQVKENKATLEAARNDPNPVVRTLANVTNATTYRLAENTNDALAVAGDSYRRGMQDSFARNDTAGAVINYAGSTLVSAGDGMMGWNRIGDHRSTVEETRNGMVTAGTNLALGGVTKAFKLKPSAGGPAPKSVGAPRSTAAPKADAAYHRSFVKTAPAKAAEEVGKLSPAELRAIYPEGGAIPGALKQVAGVNGFADFARANPRGARVLADAYEMFDGVGPEIAKRGLNGALKHFEPMMPRVTPHPTDPRYVVVTRSPGSPSWMPEVNLRPSRTLDHNGAFHQRGTRPGMLWGEHQVPTNVQNLHNMAPSQLRVNGVALSNMDGTMVFSGHGSPGSFAGLTTDQAARMSAQQIMASPKGSIKNVVLDACHQRDRRWFLGGSNAEAYERALNRELVAGGHPPVTVLAAERGGPLYGTHQKNFLGQSSPARYTPASDGAKLYVAPEDVLLGSTFAATAAGGYYIYKNVQPRGNPR